MSNIEVIGAGFGRTGTHSMRMALNHLGYKTYHMVEAIENPARNDYVMWGAWMRGERADEGLVQKVLGTYTATMDQPASTCYKELLRRNPKAKVVLTVRDPEKWYKSAFETIFKFETLHFNTWFLWIFPRFRYVRDGIADCVSTPVYGGYKSYKNKELCIKVYKDHVEEVKRTVPADQLLVFEVKEGWGPLCKFLGKPVPDIPFPESNDTAEFKKMIMFVKIVDKTLFAGAVALIAVAAYYIKSHFF